MKITLTLEDIRYKGPILDAIRQHYNLPDAEIIFEDNLQKNFNKPEINPLKLLECQIFSNKEENISNIIPDIKAVREECTKQGLCCGLANAKMFVEKIREYKKK